MYEWRNKMDYTVPKKFYELQYGWYRDIDLDYEAEQLLKVLDSAKKENDIQNYIKENKNGSFRLRFLKTMILAIMKPILV